ncbi:MAG: hypothetical protein QOH06_3659 [Acidobacteriota bacterium]|nr:hypothetical protein [Acidobacteriota bacterium]
MALLKQRQALAKEKLPQEQEPATADAIAAFRSSRTTLLEAHSGFKQAYAAARDRISEELGSLASTDRFREAVIWQNREAAVTGLDEIVRNQGSQRNSRRRQNEELVASYLQRYSVKNDTIGFFGPVGWSELVDHGGPVSIRTGQQLLAHREVYFESWCIDALAVRLASDPEIRPWLSPRLRNGFHLSGCTLHWPGGHVTELSPAQALLIEACDGVRTAEEIAAELPRIPATPFSDREQVYEALHDLHDLGLCIWTLDIPLELYPERTLRRLLAKIEPEEPRTKALVALDELEEARRRVERSAGNATALEASLRALEDTFVRLTGTPARRRAGQLYAARGLVYEDCRRAGEARFGPDLLARLGPPLTLLLRSAGWLAGEMARQVDGRLKELHAEIEARTGSPVVDSCAFLSAALTSLSLDSERPSCLQGLRKDFQDRWQRVLSLRPESDVRHVRLTVAQIAGRFEDAFGDAGPAWSLVRYFSPDIMIAASSEESFRAGSYQLVVGEIHPTNTLSWSCFASQHLCIEELLRNLEHDMQSHPVLVPQLPKTTWVQRMNISLVLPRFLRYELAEQPPGHPQCRSLPAAGVVIERQGDRLSARTRDGRIGFNAIELLGLQLTEHCARILASMFPLDRHSPRMTLDDLVIARERWRFPVSELEFAALQDPTERFLATRRWARRHGLPRFCFYRSPREQKPIYLDLDSPIYVDIFARLARACAEGPYAGRDLLVSEMLPRIDQVWLSDHEGHQYTCELRLAALDTGSFEPTSRPRR